ncbi:hypothetical protein CISIN_1g048344mg [Citrus sinensis]|uniref:F-box domain-containing protein n=1 Tax=Citrus sinensis TaxID=2711 RepID=A0A067GB89_CITSI|nr:hypothetical protein CISIN_1g048344mg [Citrus sinensis]
MADEEVLKAVFPFLDGKDLASCMVVSKQWRDIARDDYYGSAFVQGDGLRFASDQILPRYIRPLINGSIVELFSRQGFPSMIWNFFIDIWSEDKLIFSEVVAGTVLQNGMMADLSCDLEVREYKMTIPVEPRFTVTWSQNVSVSVLVVRKDSNRVACIINKSRFEYIDRTAGIRGWISLRFVEDGDEGVLTVFGIEMDFCDAANSKEEVLWLLDMLDWK